MPNEKEAVYGELDKWTAWESEFPVIAVAKALNILKQRKQWKRVIQVCSQHIYLYIFFKKLPNTWHCTGGEMDVWERSRNDNGNI